MEKTGLNLPDTQLLGIKVRTSYQNETNPLTSEIALCVQRYWQEGVADKLPNRVNPGRLFAAYFEYESDYTGEYSYFLGEEVSSVEEVPDGLSSLVVPAGAYTKFTTMPAPIPHVIMDAWQKIWQLDASELGGERKYAVDFEIYDERALNPMAAVIDVYVGTK